MKQLLVALLMAAGITAAQAQVTGNVGLTSDYRFRGISQTQNGAAVQGGADYAHASGFYVGNWNSSVSSELYSNGSGLESDVYGGYKREIANGVTLDVGSYNYLYPRASGSHGKKFDTNEIYAGVSYGPVTGKVSYALSDYFGMTNTKGTTYWQLDAAKEVMPKITAVAHVGRTDVANSSRYDYTDWNVGLVYDLKGWQVGGRYYTNTGLSGTAKSFNTVEGQKLYKDAVVLSVSKTF